MTEIREIPIVARGRIIRPEGEDSELFYGRGGAQFRSPDPHRHIHDLVLGNPVLLSDLMETPTSQIIEFLVEVGKRLRLEDNAFFQESFELGLLAGGLSEPILRSVYERLPAMFDGAVLSERVEQTIGSAYLDGWVPRENLEGRHRIRAVGTRQLHITAGNVPVVAATTIIGGALTKSDILIKSPSNDPLTASAIARTMIELDASHPVTRHIAVAYWKGGDEAMEQQIVRTTRIDKITAWGGMSSVKHIQKFLQPGLDLIAHNPKFSVSLIGAEALESEAAMNEAATGIAVMSGLMNQTACVNTRLVYVECGEDEDSLAKVEDLGRRIAAAYGTLPAFFSTPADALNLELEAELKSAAMEEDFYTVIGNTVEGGVVISRFPDRVDFYEQLNNRMVNLVPVADLFDAIKWCDDTTQNVGIYPESMRDRVIAPFALAGVQQFVPLSGGDPAGVYQEFNTNPAGLPHDGIEPMRRSVRWVIDHRPARGQTTMTAIAAE
ncbi:MAG: long-chain-fatty-acyl-CoA reductase [Betaproteobacteria bacterium]|nr:long-chain-fatty-acyl-CoA reductase [Betaproteobacteria bacterium]